MSGPPPLKTKSLPETVDKLKIRAGDSVLVLRESGEVEVYVQVKAGKELNLAALTAIGLKWTLENDEWRIKMCKKAKSKVEGMIAGRDES